MNYLGTAAFVFLALTTLAYAADPYADLYSNTLVYSSRENGVRKFHVQKDGTWTWTSSDGKSASGQWAVLGKFVCVFHDATPKEKPVCSDAVSHKVGEKWSEGAEHVTIIAGRQ